MPINLKLVFHLEILSPSVEVLRGAADLRIFRSLNGFLSRVQ